VRVLAEATSVIGASGLSNPAPEYLAIATGNEQVSTGERAAMDRQTERLNVAAQSVASRPTEFSGQIDVTVVRQTSRWTNSPLLLAGLTLVAGGLLASALYLRR
jgi:hypothetical protein